VFYKLQMGNGYSSSTETSSKLLWDLGSLPSLPVAILTVAAPKPAVPAWGPENVIGLGDTVSK
jgi:hypothetical protein